MAWLPTPDRKAGLPRGTGGCRLLAHLCAAAGPSCLPPPSSPPPACRSGDKTEAIERKLELLEREEEMIREEEAVGAARQEGSTPRLFVHSYVHACMHSSTLPFKQSLWRHGLRARPSCKALRARPCVQGPRVHARPGQAPARRFALHSSPAGPQVAAEMPTTAGSTDARSMAAAAAAAAVVREAAASVVAEHLEGQSGEWVCALRAPRSCCMDGQAARNSCWVLHCVHLCASEGGPPQRWLAQQNGRRECPVNDGGRPGVAADGGQLQQGNH